MNPLAICYDDVARAHERIAGVAHHTPVLRSTTADDLLGEIFAGFCIGT